MLLQLSNVLFSIVFSGNMDKVFINKVSKDTVKFSFADLLIGLGVEGAIKLGPRDGCLVEFSNN